MYALVCLSQRVRWQCPGWAGAACAVARSQSAIWFTTTPSNPTWMHGSGACILALPMRLPAGAENLKWMHGSEACTLALPMRLPEGAVTPCKPAAERWDRRLSMRARREGQHAKPQGAPPGNRTKRKARVQRTGRRDRWV